MPIHVAITRRVKIGREGEFQQALRDFFQKSFAQDGVLGAHMLTPLPGSDSREFGLLRTFVDEKTRDEFFESGMFKAWEDRKSTRLNSSHLVISYAVFCLKKKKIY